jgi:hypothetical protein
MLKRSASASERAASSSPSLSDVNPPRSRLDATFRTKTNLSICYSAVLTVLRALIVFSLRFQRRLRQSLFC